MIRPAFAALCCIVLAACGNPLDGVTRLSEVDLAKDETVASLTDADDKGVLDEAKTAKGDGGVKVASASSGFNLFGLLGGGASKAAEPATDGPLAFGQVRRVCGVSGGQLGKQIEKYPQSGTRYRLYDSAPGTAGPRPFFVTGFSDGCAREVNGAMGMFGGIRLHETLRYAKGSGDGAWGPVDKAYERIKGSVCGVTRGTPCGSGLARLERGTVFLTLYENYSEASRWTNVLLHDGGVEAYELQQP